MSTITDFYSNSVKGQIGKDNWAKISEGKADPEILAIARLCAVATGKETINDVREEQALIAKATKGLLKLGLGANLNKETLPTTTAPVNATAPVNTAAGTTPAGNSVTTPPPVIPPANTPNPNGEPSGPITAEGAGANTTPPPAGQQQEDPDPIELLTKRINTLAIEAAEAATTEERRKAIQKEIQDLSSMRSSLQTQNQKTDKIDQGNENQETEAERRASEAERRATEAEAREAQANARLAEEERKQKSAEATAPIRTETDILAAENRREREKLQGIEIARRQEQARQRQRTDRRREITNLHRDLSKLVGL